MLEFLQPMLTVLIGAALSIFGLIHSLRLAPAPSTWHGVAAAAPQLVAVMVFIGCLAIAVAGIALLVTALRSVRRRFGLLRRVRWEAETRSASRYDDADEPWR